MYSLNVHVGPITDLKDVFGTFGITAHDYSFHDPHCYRVGNCAFDQNLEGKLQQNPSTKIVPNK